MSFVEHCPPARYDTGCTHCAVPEFPADKQIDHERPLQGTTSIPWKHVLVLLHGVADFSQMASKINLIPGLVAQDFEVLKRKVLSPLHPVTLSNALIQHQSVGLAGGRHRIRVYPDNVEVEFEPGHVHEFMEHYLLPSEASTAAVHNPFQSSSTKPRTRVDHLGLFHESTPEKDLVVICAHHTRDVRCGLLAPLLAQEFDAVLRHEQLEQHVDVGYISHIGGHAYAGNVLIFPKDARQMPMVWYGRVFPESVQGVVEATIKNRQIIRDLYRGRPEEPGSR